MNIAIVIDEKILAEAVEIVLRFYVKKFWAKYESKVHSEIFHSAEDFITYFSPKIYRLVILGVNMRGIARFIRANDNTDVRIFFMDDCEEN